MEQNQRVQDANMIKRINGYQHWFTKRNDTNFKSMIIERGSIHEDFTSQRLILKESECTLNLEMFKLFKVFHIEINRDKAYHG